MLFIQHEHIGADSPVFGRLSASCKRETVSMNQQQRAAALKLLTALHGNADAERLTVIYGYCFQHLTSYAEAACRYLLVIKERCAGYSPLHCWTLSSSERTCFCEVKLLTGLPLRRAPRRSHGRPCAGMDVPPPLLILQRL